MTTEFSIRPERPEDAEAIDRLVTQAFAGHPHSSGTEAAIIRNLRADNALASQLVAVSDGDIVGEITFSPVTMGDGAVWLALGPIAVRPDLQGQGIGSALIRTAFDRLDEDTAGYILVGDVGYYGRFDFTLAPQVTVPGVSSDHVLVRALWTPAPKGKAVFHPAFGLPE